jgi:uncharacterized surface protein with fasciclin (FAS1) repeats
MNLHRLLLTAAATIAIAGPALAQTPAAPAAPAPAAPAAASLSITPAGDIVDTLKANGQFTILLKALDASNLTAVVARASPPLTLLAPTDAAFQALPAGQLDSLMKTENSAQLQALLVYHVINAPVPLAQVQGKKGPVATGAGSSVQIDGTTTPMMINDANVVGEAQVSNGYVYAIDKVLTPGWTPPAAAPDAAAPAPTPAH